MFKIEFTHTIGPKLAALQQRSVAALAAGMYQEALAIMRDSQTNYCPVDTGNLKNSGHVEFPKIDGTNVSVRMGYGGAAAPYAAIVHENPRAGKTGGVSPSGRKYKHWARVGQWKYLERPFLDAVGNGIDERIGRRAWATLTWGFASDAGGQVE